MNKQEFRTCPESGLQFHKPAETLMRLNAVVAVVALLVGGLTALAITLTRWPTVHLLPADRFYQLLTIHGINMLIFWVIFSKSPSFISARQLCYGAAWRPQNWVWRHSS
jgi:cytochrome c oxidase subunit 1